MKKIFLLEQIYQGSAGLFDTATVSEMDFEIWNLEFLDPFMDAPDCMSLKRTNVKESETTRFKKIHDCEPGF